MISMIQVICYLKLFTQQKLLSSIFSAKKASIMYELPKLAACQGSPKMFLM